DPVTDALLTSLELPYSAQKFSAVTFAQDADTMVFFHPNVAPHRMLRSILSSVSIGSPAASHGPLETTISSTTVLVRDLDHGLLTGDKIGISGASATGGVSAANLNKSHTITQIKGTVTAASVVCTGGSRTVTIGIGAHSFLIGDRIDVRGLRTITRTREYGDQDVTDDVIPADELNRVQTITAVPSGTTISFVVPSTVATGNGTSDGASTGGNGGTWNALDKYTITVAAAATSTVT